MPRREARELEMERSRQKLECSGPIELRTTMRSRMEVRLASTPASTSASTRDCSDCADKDKVEDLSRGARSLSGRAEVDLRLLRLSLRLFLRRVSESESDEDDDEDESDEVKEEGEDGEEDDRLRRLLEVVFDGFRAERSGPRYSSSPQ